MLQPPEYYAKHSRTVVKLPLRVYKLFPLRVSITLSSIAPKGAMGETSPYRPHHCLELMTQQVSQV